jgi:hypothetical protein
MLSPPSDMVTIPLTRPAALSLLQMRDGVKMRANLMDTNKGISGNALKDPSFLAKAEEEEWELQRDSKNETTKRQFGALYALCDAVDAAIQEKYQKCGVFFKLSVRSPKDAPIYLPSFRRIIQERIASSAIPSTDPCALSGTLCPPKISSSFLSFLSFLSFFSPSLSTHFLSDDISIIRYSLWKSLQCWTSKDVLTLLLRSERVYIDILQHDLFLSTSQPDLKEEKFHLNLHLFPFCNDPDFDPDWEFRGFVVDGVRTCLTTYSPFIFSPEISAQKDKILRLIEGVWDSVQGRIQSKNYCLDFAVSRSLSHCWIVEVNNFLPPLAGAGLFDYHDVDGDRVTLFHGPFEFRIQEKPIQETDFLHPMRSDKKEGESDGKKKAEEGVLVMRPCGHDVMGWIANLRREKESLPPLPIPAEDPLITRVKQTRNADRHRDDADNSTEKDGDGESREGSGSGSGCVVC